MFKHQIRVAYRDVTVGNHVYYSRYLDLLEIARNELFRNLGYPLIKLQEEQIIFPVVECHLQFKAAARYDDLLEIEMLVSNLGRVQFTLEYTIQREGITLVTASTRHATTTLAEKPTRMPSDLYEALSKHANSQVAI
jgi:acyl-CoA thioester hydrolase